MKPKKTPPRLDPDRKPSAAVRGRARAVKAAAERDEALERMRAAQAASSALRGSLSDIAKALNVAKRQLEAVRHALGDSVVLPAPELLVSSSELDQFRRYGMVVDKPLHKSFGGPVAIGPEAIGPMFSAERLQLVEVDLERVPDWTRSKHFRLITRAGERAYAADFDSLALLMREEVVARIADEIHREVIDTTRRFTRTR